MMANSRLWEDGRSGEAGCVAGSIALRSLGVPVEKLKGTVFQTAQSVLIGRVCSTDSYLSEPVLHWANASWDQHKEMAGEAASSGRELLYLFITAAGEPASVQIWLVPGAVVESVFVSRQKNRRGQTCAIHIVSDDARHVLAGTEITQFHKRLTLRPSEVAELSEVYRARQGKPRPTQPPKGRIHTPDLVSAGAAYDIPVSRSRSVRVQLPGPLSPSDVNRVKQWLDLTADVLTEGYDDSETARQTRWLQEQVQTGLDELERGEGVDGEEAFERVLSRSRPPVSR